MKRTVVLCGGPHAGAIVELDDVPFFPFEYITPIDRTNGYYIKTNEHDPSGREVFVFRREGEETH